MENIFKNIKERLKERCEALTQKQRKIVLVILSTIYLILTIAIIVSVFLPDGKRQEQHRFDDLIDKSIIQDTLVIPNLTDENSEHTKISDYE